MTWFHLIVGGMHVVFPSTSILSLSTNATDGSQSVYLKLLDGTTYELTVAQALKIIGTLPGPL